RLRSKKERDAVVEGLRSGAVDIVIGTHRLLSKDVQFRNLGLLVVDEEQRFGVAHKETLKRMRTEVDVLTLTATPIPRTLQMALVGARDMSVIETPPEDRLPIKTYVTPKTDSLVRESILREIDRGGQVFYVHNRVHDIERVSRELHDTVPGVRVVIGHGQMEENQLENVMLSFIQHQHDVLLCTTIIESGLDIPNANTLLVDDAANFGLAQLYQLRGRVGRGTHRAYAYLMYRPTARITEDAQKRLDAISEATELGAGFRIAMKDLELRGAGNFLGPEQSGHVGAVGLELYTRLLERAVQEARTGEQVPEPPAVTLDLPLEAALPEEYVTDRDTRLRLYRRLASTATERDLKIMEDELRDRFGPVPEPAQNLITLIGLKLLAAAAGVTAITVLEGDLVLRLPKMPSTTPRVPGVPIRLVPGQVRFPLAHNRDRWISELRYLLIEMADLAEQETELLAASSP
ncbi:MAG: transcription-repair coupling factor, partial [Chloroflexota bacterium]|nr:transcription-repair coupling factor [Chloroflexota bacterium]